MSVVSGIVLCVDVAEDMVAEDGPPVLMRRVDAWLEEKWDYPGRKLVEVTDYAGGTKHPQMCIFAGGFNHFRSLEVEFGDFVVGLPWKWPENVVLVIQPEEGPSRVWRGRTANDRKHRVAGPAPYPCPPSHE